ncbi:MAG TPA: hypothetical protein VK424_02530 [Thermoplasmata archaeon]|nr:hypothetical protein [Thermoplasmata archaeon]
MSHIFQRPLCQLGMAYDYSFRPTLGDPDPSYGGGCDERPHRVELYSAQTDPRSATAEWQPFGLCDEHEGQLRQSDVRQTAQGTPSRFRAVAAPQGRR